MGSYFGSKATSGLCQPIIALMPPHDTYIETHLGGGAIMKRKPPALHNIGIDLNPRALAAFECDYPVKKVNDCAHRFLAEYDYGGRELIYSDPPYLHHTRTSGRRYRFDYEEQDHIELLELLKTLPCNVILSGYPSALYDERLAGWRTLELQVMNHAGVRTEKLWFNFTPDRVHWASCAGRNFTDRQRIKRRAANWGKNYRALPRAERLAVLAAMMAVEAEDAPDPGEASIMATVNKQSLREEFDALKGEFERLCASGKMTADSRALFQAMLMLFEVLRVVFMEKRTPKNSTNVVLRLLVEFGEGNCALTHAGNSSASLPDARWRGINVRVLYSNALSSPDPGIAVAGSTHPLHL